MATSLAEQLKRLAVPQTSILQQDKKRPSLLFDPKEAAGLRRETVYQIGLDGLDELISRNPTFDQFKNTLFNLSTKDVERSVQTKDANTKLDKSIRKFLLLCSPYFLLKCTHQALEWLINRFHIQDYNREDLLMLIMPYHESNIFVRVVQLMKFRDHQDSWYFLKSLQKTGVHLTKTNLITHAANDVHFLKFTTKFLSSLLKVHEKLTNLTIAFNFYCTIFTGTIEYSREVNEAQIVQMLPALIRGLYSDIPDYCAASYIIVARLAAKTVLNDSVLDSFVQRITQINVDTLRIEAILTLIVLYQSQKHYKRIGEEAIGNLAFQRWLPKVLQDLNNSGSSIWTFLEILFRGGIAVGLEKDEKGAVQKMFVKNLLSGIRFDPEFVGRFISVILDVVSLDKKYSKLNKEWISDILETLERQYPEQFDKEIYKILSSTSQDSTTKNRTKCLQKIFKSAMTLRRNFDVFDKLYHPNPEFRKEAVKYLAKNFDQIRDSEKEMIRTSLIDRLNDDNISVVKDTLKVVKNLLIMDKALLKETLINLSAKCQKDMETWQIISLEVVKVLCSLSKYDDWETALAVFPYLIPSTKAELVLAKEILKNDFIQNNELFKSQSFEQLSESDDTKKFCSLFFENFTNKDLDLVQNFIVVLQEVAPENRTVLHKFSAMLILSHILPENSPISICSLIIEIFAAYFESSGQEIGKVSGYFDSFLNVARHDKFPLSAYLICVNNVVKKTEKVEIDLTSVDFCVNNEFNKYFILMANILVKNFKSYKKYTVEFFDHFFENLQSKIEFLLNLGICGNHNLEKSILNFVNVSLALMKEADESSFKEFSLDKIFPFSLILLLNKDEVVRKKTLDIISNMVNTIKQQNEFLKLFKKLLEQSEEIVLDEEQVPLVLFNCIENTKSKQIISFLLNSIEKPNIPLYTKEGILKLLTFFDDVKILEKASILGLEFLETAPASIDPIQWSILKSLAARCVPSAAPDIKLSNQIWKFIETCLKTDNASSGKSPSVLILDQITKDFFELLPIVVQKELVNLIINLATTSQNTEVLALTRHIFKHIDLDANLVLNHFVKMKNVQSPKLDPTKLKRRISVVPTIDILDTLEWREGVTALEFIQDKKKIRNLNILLPILFDVLKKCLDFDEQTAVEYPKQLILSSVLHCCYKLETESLPENVFNIELIVQCIRASQNPQTHHHALLVLAYAAKLIPTQVLHHVMAIFTFMGSSVLRHDDAYSYQIIFKIIDAVIPILVTDNTSKTITKILRVFVDAFLDVPEHRRVPLYSHLLTKIGAKENLFIFLLLIFESHVLHSNQRDKTSEGDVNKKLDITASFCCEFTPEIVLSTCISLMKFLKALPEEIEQPGDLVNDIIDLYLVTPKQFRHYKYTLVTFISSLLGSAEFVTKIAALSADESLGLENLHKDLIVNVLTYIQSTSKVVDKNLNTPQAQYWKVMLHHSYDILDSVNALLTPQMFVLVIKGLVLHHLPTVRRRALELLNSKLQYDPSFFDDCKGDEVYNLIPSLVSIIRSSNSGELDSEQELIVQTGLLSLKLLVKLLAPKGPEKFLDILNFITDLIKSGTVHNNVLASVVLCLAELCVNLRAHAVSSLPHVMPALIKIFKHEKLQETPSLLMLSTITCILKILEILALFLSPYLERLLFELTIIMSKCGGKGGDDQKLQTFNNKLAIIKEKIGSTIPPRVLIPNIERTYQKLIEKSQFNAIGPLMDVLSENLKNLRGPDITANLPDLTNFFLTALQFRTDQSTSMKEASIVENQIIKALSSLILKLSETTFRPLYYKLFDWAVRAEVKSERLITFYALSSGIAENLKGLFVLFAGHFLNNAAQILDACNKIKNETLYFDDDQKNILLLENILSTLTAVFTYDTSKFINKDRFDMLMQPLVDQLENGLDCIERLEARNVKFLTPCIVQFAVATADDALWKQLNYQILLKMRHSSPNIRLIALHCLAEVVKKLGEDFLPLLPETIPFLAELLEDEEESVEKTCRKAVQEMEKILGEPLQKYF